MKITNYLYGQSLSLRCSNYPDEMIKCPYPRNVTHAHPSWLHIHDLTHPIHRLWGPQESHPDLNIHVPHMGYDFNTWYWLDFASYWFTSGHVIYIYIAFVLSALIWPCSLKCISLLSLVCSFWVFKLRSSDHTLWDLMSSVYPLSNDLHALATWIPNSFWCPSWDTVHMCSRFYFDRLLSLWVLSLYFIMIMLCTYVRAWRFTPAPVTTVRMW